ncbi:MAG: hypothetical protein MK105_00785 [Crocinitomicaceae bacterium]|nr:hypothetical protein [Crocinitomicaceae bacterium]
MNVLKSIVLGLTLIVGISAHAQRQDQKKSSEDKAARLSTKMIESLDLDENKSAEVSRINSEFMNKLEITKKDELMNKEAKKLQIEVAKQERDTQLKSLLSSDEYAKYEAMNAEKAEAKQEKKDNREKKSPAEKAKIQTEKMAQDLGLNEEQKEKVLIINEGINVKNQGIKSNNSFTEEQKKEYLKENRKAKNRMLSEILTPEQMDMLKSQKKENRSK